MSGRIDALLAKGTERILVLGCAGAGKSRLAGQLGAALDLPVIHLDHHYWRPGWVEPTREEWRAQILDLLAQRAWVMDGNYGGTVDLRLEAAEAAIVLDLPRWRCLSGVLRRTLHNLGREVQAPGCPEHIDWAFLAYVWRFPSRSRPRLMEACRRHVDRVPIIVLRSRTDVRRLLGQLPVRPRT